MVLTRHQKRAFATIMFHSSEEDLKKLETVEKEFEKNKFKDPNDVVDYIRGLRLQEPRAALRWAESLG